VSARQSLRQILLVPAILGAVALAGLILALVADGTLDLLASAALISPLAAAAIALGRRRP
jgi:hypothetical protein